MQNFENKRRTRMLAMAAVIAMALCVLAAIVPGDTDAADPIPGESGNPFTSVSSYNDAIKDGGWNGKDVYLTISNQDFDEDNLFNLTNVQAYTNPPKLHLTITDCSFTGNTSGDSTNPSFMYLPNCQYLVIRGCTFDSGADGLKYGINWNLIQIQNSTAVIEDCTFEGSYTNNALKFNQRNGADDAAADVKVDGYSPASMAFAIIKDCTFNGARLDLGSQGKGAEGAASPSTGDFPVTIIGTDVTVGLAYMASGIESIPTVSVSSDGVWKGCGDGLTEVMTAKVGNTVYATVQDAIDDAPSGMETEITLMNDVVDTSICIPEGKTISIVTNGYDMVGLADSGFIINHGVLTMDGDAGSHIYTMDVWAQGRHAVVNYGTMTINGGVFGDSDSDRTNANSVQRGNAVRNYGTMTINGGSFTVCDNYVNGGYAYAIANGSSSYPDAVMTINYAEAYGSINGILASDGGRMAVYDGSYVLGDGTENNLWRIAYTSGNGTIEIFDGEYTREVNNAYAFFGYEEGSITINGGMFYDLNRSGGSFKDNDYELHIKGGTFNIDVSSYLEPGYSQIVMNDMYSVGKAPSQSASGAVVSDGENVVAGGIGSTADITLQSGSVTISSSDGSPIGNLSVSVIDRTDDKMYDDSAAQFEIDIVVDDGVRYRAEITVPAVIPSGFTPVMYYIDGDRGLEPVEVSTYSSSSVTFVTDHTTSFVMFLDAEDAPGYVPGWDDDDDYPIIAPEQPESDDDSEVAVIVAAAAAAAVLMCVFVLMGRGKI